MTSTLPELVNQGAPLGPEDASQDRFESCEVCARILSGFTAPVDEDYKLPMGKVATLLQGPCPHVKYLKNVERIHDTIPQGKQEDFGLRRWAGQTDIVLGVDYERENGGFWTTTRPMNLIFRKEVLNHPGRALVLNPNWIDAEVVRGWISACNETHGMQCRSLPLLGDEERIQPMYLVDTKQNCVVRGGETMTTDYVALSYIWGGISALKNESSLLQRLQAPGSLNETELGLQISRTVRDAMAVVRCLGERYLWVDALCIVQDDEEQLESELNMTHRIFAGASFTIIAAGATNANYELRGFREFTTPRSVRQEPVQLAASERIMQSIAEYESTNALEPKPASNYYTRAWTFQEHLFSTRRLIFEKESVRWECQCYEWHEDLLPHEIADQRWIDFSERWFHCAIPTLDELSNIVMEYNPKKLTYSDDAFRAFLGIQSTLHRIFPGGIIYGHPELFFDISLTWHPLDAIRRRRASLRTASRIASGNLPSWSWIGWDGRLAFPWDNELRVSSSEAAGYTMPVAEWYAIESPSSTDRRRISSVWYEYKLLACDANSPLPPGWRREEYHVETKYHVDGAHHRRHLPRDIPKYCYKHSSFSNDGESTWYPIPVSDHEVKYPLRKQTAFVFSRTTRAYLYASGKETYVFEDSFWRCPPQIQLMDWRENRVGYLQLNSKTDLAYFDSELDQGCKKQVELVATCKGYTERIFDYRLTKEERYEKLHLEDCYFVLWIEWKNGVAFRKAAGAVTAKAWQREKQQDLVDLILG
ncbi:MAG: hypothetical protein M1821_008194 [Bathelium mastoideum]|nr:MAG: hypothetical protein M1821_008194 [Bathelium mastoideum]